MRREARALQAVDFSGFDFSNLTSDPNRQRERGDGRALGSEAAGGFRDIFSQIFSRGERGGRSEEQETGRDLEYRMHLGFWDAIRGAQVRVHRGSQETCPRFARAPARSRARRR